MTLLPPRVIGQPPEIIFTCLRCEQNYMVPTETFDCPACGWRSEFAARVNKEPKR